MGWRYPLLSIIGLLAANMAVADAPLHLKVRREGASYDTTAVARVMPRRRTAAGRRHLILQFREAPGSIDKQELTRRGIRILGAVPESALMVSVPDEVSVEDLDLRWAGALPPESKVSPDIPVAASLAAGRPGHYVVELHADVDAREADELVTERGLEMLNHPDLLPNQRLVRGSADQILRLVEWDEVDYVFPASQDLIEGRHVIACAGAQTEDGLIAQYIAKVGEGWDGPGQNAAELGYYFRSFSSKVDPGVTRSEVARALAEWARYVKLTFTPASVAGLARTIDILFAPGSHGDGYAFDGAGGVIAHTFYPAPPNSEPLAGDMHMDADEAWRVNADTDLYSVTLHELGHALGLGHSDRPGSVMYPYYRRADKLAGEDIAAIRALYAEQTESTGGDSPQPAPLKLTIQSPAGSPVTTNASSLFLSGITTGGTTDPAVTWVSDRSYSGTGQGSRQWVIQPVPLSVGSNVITVTAADGTSAPVSVSVFVIREAEVVAPGLAIASPSTAGSYASASSSVVLSGTASRAAGISRVVWSNSRGGNGVAIGTTSWSTPPIALSVGSNTITVTAYEPGGQSTSRQLVISYAGAVQDTVAPTLRIISPGSTSLATTASAITIQGTAADNVGVDSVRWLTSTRKSGTAAGTSIWIIENLPLYIGTNVVKIQAFDAAGNMSWRSLMITRR
ncbi:MAG: matrixin family metalloprotease [Bryobacteraceae bacterium]